MFSNFHGAIRRGLAVLATVSLVVTVPAVSHAVDNGGIPQPNISMLTFTTNGSQVSDSPTTDMYGYTTYKLANDTTKMYFTVNDPSDPGATFLVPFFQSSGVSISVDTLTDDALGSSTACARTIANGGGGCGGTLDGSGQATFTVTLSGVSANSTFKFQLNGAVAQASKFSTITFGGTVTGPPGPTPTASATPTPTATGSVPSSVNVKLTPADASAMFDKSVWWRENANSRSMVKYVPKGSVLTVSYVVTNSSGSPVAGANVVLGKSSVAGPASFSGATTVTTDADGIATFSLTENGTKTENARADYTVWSDAVGGQVEMDFLPTVTGASTYIGRDRIWSHVVPADAVVPNPDPSATATATPTPTATSAGWTIRQTTFDNANSTNKSSDAATWVANGWYKAGLTYREAHVTVGTSKTITYHVTDSTDTAAPSQDVTFVFGKQYSQSTANVTVGSTTSAGEGNRTVTATTDANGDVSFTLVNNDSSVGAKLFTQVTAYVTAADLDVVDITDVIYDPVGGATATPTPTQTMGSGWVANPNISWLTATSNGTAVSQSSSSTAYVFASNTTRINFSLHSPSGAGQTFQVVPFEKTGINVSVATIGSAQGSPTACDPDVANAGAGCMGSFDASGNATFAFTVSGVSTSSLFKVQINGVTGSVSNFATITFNGTPATSTPTPTPTPTATATPTPTPTPTVSAPLARTAAKVVGTAKIGKTITVSRGTWTGATSFTYKWYACSASGSSRSSAPAGCVAISGATTSSLKLTAARKGKYIRVQVKGTNRAGSAYSYSATSAKVS